MYLTRTCSTSQLSTVNSKKPEQEMELFHQSQNESAIKIQSFARKILAKNNSHLKIKKRIQEHMKTLAAKIKYSISASIVNKNTETTIAEIENAWKNQSGDIDEFQEQWNLAYSNVDFLKNLLNIGFANCKEYALVLYCLIMEDPEIDAKFKDTLQITSLAKPEDHFFLTSKHEEHSLQVHDGWMHLINFEEQKLYRKAAVLSSSKLRGYDGDAEDYRFFLNYHADGKYIKKSVTHKFIPYRLPANAVIYNPDKRKKIWNHVYQE